jgi:hypothetical protein
MNKLIPTIIGALAFLAVNAHAQESQDTPVQPPTYSTDNQQDTYSYSLPDVFQEKQDRVDTENQNQENPQDQEQRQLLIQNIRRLYQNHDHNLQP